MLNLAKKKRLKILLWSPKGAGLHYHGPGASMYRLFQQANRSLFDITLVHGSIHQSECEIFSEQKMIYPIKNNYFSGIYFILKSRKWIKENILNYDVFQTTSGFHESVLPAYWSQQHGVSSFVRVAGHRRDLASKKGFRALLSHAPNRRKLIAQLSGIIAISQHIVEELREYEIPEEKIVYIHNGVNVHSFYPAEVSRKSRLQKKYNLRNIPTILFVGAVEKRKALHKIIEAVNLLDRENIECQLIIVGPEKEKKYTSAMRNRIEELNLNEKVLWYGAVNDVAPFYHMSDIFVLPSNSEGMPNALLEAMASGLPSITTKISGTVDVIEDGKNGFLISGTIKELKNRLKYLIQKPMVRKYLGEKARLKMVTYFSGESVLEQYQRVYLQAVNRSTSPQ